MDGLAETGLLFTRAYSSNPLCVPFRASAFTGRYSHEAGVMKNDDLQVKVPTEKFPSMGAWLQKGGYKTAYSGKCTCPSTSRTPRSMAGTRQPSSMKSPHAFRPSSPARAWPARPPRTSWSTRASTCCPR
ncbi:MAG: hypothetical protein EHM17_07195 [Verrucomicrobiaceae bacterium]|nr:MAG: hypothetical protein EHM17_07195 [Verrucomicrobiaceae bacterium]